MAEIKPTGRSLELAATEFAGAMKLLGNRTSLVEAVRYYVKHHPVSLPRITVRQAVDEMIAEKKRRTR